MSEDWLYVILTKMLWNNFARQPRFDMRDPKYNDNYSVLYYILYYYIVYNTEVCVIHL